MDTEEKELNEIRAFQMRGLCLILHVSWMERKTSGWVLENAGTDKMTRKT